MPDHGSARGLCRPSRRNEGPVREFWRRPVRNTRCEQIQEMGNVTAKAYTLILRAGIRTYSMG